MVAISHARRTSCLFFLSENADRGNRTRITSASRHGSIFSSDVLLFCQRGDSFGNHHVVDRL